MAVYKCIDCGVEIKVPKGESPDPNRIRCVPCGSRRMAAFLSRARGTRAALAKGDK